MSWTAPRTFVTGEVETAAIFNTHLRDNMIALQPVAASIATLQTTASTTYTDLATTGPAVTLTTGTSALVTITAYMSTNTAGDGAAAATAVSGATTSAAADVTSMTVGNFSAGQAYQYSATNLITGLTAGSNTFTMKYKAITGGTASFQNRQIVVESPFS